MAVWGKVWCGGLIPHWLDPGPYLFLSPLGCQFYCIVCPHFFIYNMCTPYNNNYMNINRGLKSTLRVVKVVIVLSYRNAKNNTLNL